MQAEPNHYPDRIWHALEDGVHHVGDSRHQALDHVDYSAWNPAEKLSRHSNATIIVLPHWSAAVQVPTNERFQFVALHIFGAGR